MSCELCQADGVKLYEDEICWVRECNPSGLLVASKLHGLPEVEDGNDLEEMIEVGRVMGNKVYGEGKWFYDYSRGNSNHFCFYIRKKS